MGFPIPFQTLTLEKFMLHEYFKQHFMHQKFKREISNLPFLSARFQAGKSLGFHKMKEKNGLLSYILGGKSGFTMLHKFINCARLSLKIHMSQINFNLNHELTVHINLLPPSPNV